MKQIKAYKFRLYPTLKQEKLIEHTIGCCRFVYNYSLSRQKQKESLWYITEELFQNGQLLQNNWNREFFKKNEAVKAIKELKVSYAFLKEVDSIALQDSVERLHKAYDKYYKTEGGKPRFKSKRHDVQSYTTKMVNGNISIEKNHIKLPKLGLVKVKYSHVVKGMIKRATISKSLTGKYFVSLNCEVEIQPLSQITKTVGIDVGLKEFAVCSDGIVISKPRAFQKLEKRLAFMKRKLNRQQYKSKNYAKTKMQLIKLHEKIYNKRQDFLHQLSTKLIRENQALAIENLKTNKFLKMHQVTRGISELAWSEFRRQLEYKGVWYGRQIKVAPSHYASSQRCSCCGYQNALVKELNLRCWSCPQCQMEHHRDLNAAINLQKLIA